MTRKVSITVKPGSKKGPMVQPGLLDDELLVYVREPALEGKANKAVVQLVAEYYDVPKTKVEIVRGLTSSHKMLRIDGSHDD